jgi:hypothetical protein
VGDYEVLCWEKTGEVYFIGRIDVLRPLVDQFYFKNFRSEVPDIYRINNRRARFAHADNHAVHSQQGDQLKDSEGLVAAA